MPKQIDFFIFFGLIASGKSTLAAAWAEKMGAGYYNSDIIRKGLAGLMANTPQAEVFNAGIYSPEFSRRTYDELLARAGEDLGQGKKVVLDGSYQDLYERSLVVDLAEKNGLGFRFILCQCSEDVTKERLAIRANDKDAVSDGRWEIYCQQVKKFNMPDELKPGDLIILNTEKSVNNLLDDLAGSLR